MRSHAQIVSSYLHLLLSCKQTINHQIRLEQRLQKNWGKIRGGCIVYSSTVAANKDSSQIQIKKIPHLLSPRSRFCTWNSNGNANKYPSEICAYIPFLMRNRQFALTYIVQRSGLWSNTCQFDQYNNFKNKRTNF